MVKLYHDFTGSEKQLMKSAKAHFISLKKLEMPVIPFGMISSNNESPQLMALSALQQDWEKPLIEQLWLRGLSLQKKGKTSCYAVCFDAYVQDEEQIDEDALVLQMKKEDGKLLQINIPYVEDEGEIVYGKLWLSKL